MGQPMDVTSAN